MKTLSTKTRCTDHGLLYKGEMIRALMQGRKTQTRRLVKNVAICDVFLKTRTNSDGSLAAEFGLADYHARYEIKCPLGNVGDTWYARETHYRYGHWEPISGKKARTRKDRQRWKFVEDSKEVLFDAPAVFRKGMHNGDERTPAWHKRIAMFMPRAAARIRGRIASIRVERLQDITEADAISEGIERRNGSSGWTDYAGEIDYWRDYQTERGITSCPKNSYRTLWDSINTEPGTTWADNPWVFVYGLEVLK